MSTNVNACVRLVLHAKITVYITANGQEQQLKEWFNTFVNCKGINKNCMHSDNDCAGARTPAAEFGRRRKIYGRRKKCGRPQSGRKKLFDRRQIFFTGG